MEVIPEVTTNDIAQNLFDQVESKTTFGELMEIATDTFPNENIVDRYLVGIKLTTLAIDDFVEIIPERTIDMQQYYNWIQFTRRNQDVLFNKELGEKEYFQSILRLFNSDETGILRAQMIPFFNGLYVYDVVNALQGGTFTDTPPKLFMRFINNTTTELRGKALPYVQRKATEHENKVYEKRLFLASQLLKDIDKFDADIS